MAASFAAGFLSASAALEDFHAAIDYGSQLEDLSRKTGQSVESLDALALTAKLSGITIDQLSLALDKLSKNMVQAANPDKPISAVFDALNVSLVDAQGNMRNTVDVML